MTKLCPNNVLAQKWHLTYFVPIDAHFGQMFWDMNFTFVLHTIYVNFDLQTPKTHSNARLKFFWRPKLKNPPWLVCAKSILTLILNVSDKFIRKCRRSRLFGEWHLGKMGFLDMATLVIFLKLGLINFKLGLYIKVNVNVGQNKFEVHISKNEAKMAINWHKIGQMPLLGKNSNLA